tara:strand:- start:24 stop:230 length:207 start_codon:yes stop_codon:yes gene_type:complete
MATQSQKNAQEIIKVQGEIKLIHNKISVIKDNHLAHLDKKVDNVYKLLWTVTIISLSSLTNFLLNLLQ